MRSRFRRCLSSILAAALALSLCVPAAGASESAAQADPELPPYAGTGEGTITVAVKDAVTGEGLEGATVRLEDLTAGRYTQLEPKTTGPDGTVTWDLLSSGQYRVTEIQAPEFYKLDSTAQTLWLADGVDAARTVNIYNKAEAGLYIYRCDPATGKPLSGSHVMVTDGGANTWEGTTGEDGYFRIEHVPDGTYTVTETAAPAGYKVTPGSKTVTVRTTGSSDPYIVALTGSQLATIIINIRDVYTLAGIPGTEWKVTETGSGASSENNYGGLISSAAGIVTVTDVKPGTYLVEQVTTADGYMKKMASATVKVTDSTSTVTVNLFNTPLGSVSVDVTDSLGTGIAGATFTLYAADGTIAAGPVTADASGHVDFGNIPDGIYTLTVVPPPGYEFPFTSVTVEVRGGSMEPVHFTAVEKGSIVIVCVDGSDGSKMLAGATFTVKKMDGTLVGTFTTDASGTVTVPTLDTGWYMVEQTGVTDGYVMHTSVRSVYVSAGKVATVTFYSRIKPYVVVRTVMDGTGSPVAGCTVTLTGPGGVNLSGVSDEFGEVVFPDLEPGTYVARLTSAPEGYTVKLGSQNVNVTTAAAGTATLTLVCHSSITIIKTDSETQETLPGATYVVRDSAGTPVDIVTTDANGMAVTDPLKPGSYTLQEMFAPDGYVPDTQLRTVTVKSGENAAELLTNTKKGALVIYAYDKSGMPLANVSYSISRAVDGHEVAQVLTDAAGAATCDSLEPGDYVVTELVIPGEYHLVNPTQSHIVHYAGEPTYVRFVHVAKSVIKMETVDINTGRAITGAAYQVQALNGDFTGNFATDENGEAFTGVMEPGKYTVKQIVAPDGYILNTTTQTIDVLRDQVNLAKFFNRQLTEIIIMCTVQGHEYGLAGCTFTVEDEQGREVFHGTTDGTGILHTGELAPGHYTVKQIAVRDGYTVVQTVRTVEVTTGTATTVKFEQVPMTNIIIQLTDRADPLKGIPGATFQVETLGGDFVCELTTDESGFCQTEVLEPGTYVVHQTSTADGYILDQTYQWAILKEGEPCKLEFTNAKISGLIVQALAEDTHEGIPGAVFEVWEENGKLVGTYTTDSTGIFTVDGLLPGPYIVKEVTVPFGWNARTLEQKVVITTDESTTLTFYHGSQASLTVNLRDGNTLQPLPNATYRLYTSNGTYVGEYRTNSAGQFVVGALPAGDYTLEMVVPPAGYDLDPTPVYVTVVDDENVVVDITLNETKGLQIRNTCRQTGEVIPDSVFKITKFDGTLVGNFTTDRAGRIDVALAPGTYTVYQISVSEEYVINTEVYNVTVKNGEFTVLEVMNDLLSAIRIHVIDAVTQAGIYNVQVEIRDEKNNLMPGQFTTDNNGYVFLTDVLKPGRYTVKIVSVPNNYVIDTVPKTFEVQVGQTTEVTLQLTGRQGQVTITTYAGEDSVMMQIRKNSRIPGGIYTITDLSGQVVATIQGDSYGDAHSGPLPIGTYYIQQVTAPSGFMVNSTRLTVNVTSENQNIRVEVFNRAAVATMKVTVHGQTTAVAGGILKYYFTDFANNTSFPLNNFYLAIKIPTEAMRAGTFYTGTYNFETYYDIEYRTNIQGWTNLATGLNARSNYHYDLGTISMALDANEYVTDVRMVFPSVIPGFKVTQAPVLYCQLLATLPTGYHADMRAEAGGQIADSGAWTSSGLSAGYGGAVNGGSLAAGSGNPTAAGSGNWITAGSSFSTYVYAQTPVPNLPSTSTQPKLPSTLPKTGY